MNIAHILPCAATFPLQKWNARYRWVEELAMAQAALGNDVTIYCGGGHVPNVNITTTTNKTIDNEELFKIAIEARHDILHSHFDNLHYKFDKMLLGQKLVFTQHWRLLPETVSLAKEHSNNIYAVPATRYMYNANIQNHIPTVQPIYHGIDTTSFNVPAKPVERSTLCTIARIDPQKGISQAIDYALETGEKLIIVGKNIDKHKQYFDSFKHKIDGSKIVYLGQQTKIEVIKILQQSKAMILPVQEVESFGLSIVEAQACGTPVITTSSGAMSELVIDQKTGYLCNTHKDFIDAIKNIDNIKSSDCRKNSLRFNYSSMVDNYSKMYKQVLEKPD